MPPVERTHIDERDLERLLGLDSSKIGFYADVKQKIRELESANLDLRAKKNELQAVFDSIHDGVAIYGPDGRIQYRNHVCPTLFPDRTLLGKPCQALFHPETPRDPGHCPVEGALGGERRNLSFSEGDGRRARHFEVTATPILDAYGKPFRALVFLRDVTERREQELQLLQAEKMSNVGVLAAGVAHELNNPLTSAALCAEALLRRFREIPELAAAPGLEDFPEYLELIVRESHRCKAIIDSLLSFSRKSDGTMGPVHLGHLVEEVLQLVDHRAQGEQVAVDTELGGDLPPVRGDPAGLRQVVLNLTLNALQAVEGPGRIRIAAHSRPPAVALRVSDTGRGIPKDVLDQIWTPFFTTKPVGQGLGLGLSVVYHIVAQHDGEVQVETEVGKGSTFTVLLPAYEER
ncbi:MAG: ATP-binding protein [Deferrisomatales bacterium]